MDIPEPGQAAEAGILRAVEKFTVVRHLFDAFSQALLAYFEADPVLSNHILFVKRRIKDPEHLRRKLERKAAEGESIDESNLLHRITDLAGIRIIHLHTEEMREIHLALSRVLEEQQLQLLEEPTANCWDIEYENLFKSFGIETRSRESMYSTVHYVVRANQRTEVTCEVQVRTLMDEVWGEVSHRVNYPVRSPSVSSQDQLRVLARLTTGCARLVDSIFRSHFDSLERKVLPEQQPH